MNERVIAVIDGNSLMHRAFHAVQAEMSSPDGRPTNACFGFMSMLLKLISDFKPSGIIAAFDAGVPPQRLQAIKQYKAQRPPTDPDLKAQFPMVEKLLQAMNIPVVRMQDYEGDDILGTLSAMAEQHGNIKSLLISGDKDALQLASDKTHIVTNRVGMSEVRIYDPEGVFERFGVDPARVPDYLGLMGDSSDNIPGIPGVGPKTATRLLQKYGDIEGVIKHAGELKGKLAEKVAGNAQIALDSRQVATIIRDAPIELDFDAVLFPSFDHVEVKRAFGELGMMSQLRKILKLSGRESDSGDIPAPRMSRPVQKSTRVDTQRENKETGTELEPAFSLSMQAIIVGSEAQKALQKILDSAELVGLYWEGAGTQGLDSKKAQQSLVFDEDITEPSRLYIATRKSILVLSEGPHKSEGARECLKKLLLSKVPVASFNLKEALRVLAPPDTTKPLLLTKSELLNIRAFDLIVAGYLLDSDRATDDPLSLIDRFLPEVALETSLDTVKNKKNLKHSESLDTKSLEPKEINSHNSKTPAYVEYSAALAAAARVIAPELQKELIATQALQCFEDIEQPLTPVLVQMERTGVRVDTGVLKEQGDALAGRINELRKEAYRIAGVDFNLDSPKQVGEILFEKLMLPPGKKIKSGYSTDASVLTELKPLSPLPGILLEYRELAKLRSTYLEALPRLVAKDGLIHTTFNQTVAATGRLSSSDPNLQNIPIRSDIGRRIRRAFVPDAQALGAEKAVFVSADYSQIELRLLAHLSGDEHLIEAFISGEDFHRETAARVFEMKPSEVTPEMRSRAKAVNFGIVYGQQAFGLAQSLGIAFSEADEMIKRYFEAYPQVQGYLEHLKAQAHHQGWVETIFGRRRQIREVKSRNPNRRNFAERTAMNHPMQGSAADIIKLAMNRVAAKLEEDGYRSRMVLQVHDELDFNCDAAELGKLITMVTTIMQNVVKLKVPLIADVSSGSNWAEAH